MGQFPQYTTATPSGQTSNVRANLNFDTGEGQIGQAIEGIGRTGVHIGANLKREQEIATENSRIEMERISQKIQDAQDRMSISELNRKGDMIDVGLNEALTSTTDIEEQKKLIAKAEQDRVQLSGGYNERVSQAYQIGLNDTYSQRLVRAQGVGLQARVKDAEDKFNYGRAKAIEDGNAGRVKELDDLALSSEIIRPEQYKMLQESAPMDISISKVKRLAITNPNDAKTVVDSWDVSKLNDRQLIAREGVLRDIELGLKQKQVDSNILGNSVVREMYVATKNNISPKERVALADKLSLKVLDPNSGMSTEQTTARLNDINKWAVGKDNVDDWSVYDSLADQAKDVYLGNKSRDDYETEVNKQYNDGKLTRDSQQKLIEKMDNPLTPQQTNIIRAKTNDAKDVILGSKAGLFTTDESGKMVLNLNALNKEDAEDAKLRLWYVQQYEEDITKWMLNNDGNTGREFEQYTEGQKMRYWQTSLDDIKAKKKAKLSQIAQPSYKIGDMVTKGGKNLKVVGFDTDGDPLVDEVK